MMLTAGIEAAEGNSNFDGAAGDGGDGAASDGTAGADAVV
jgi:hypothetical protein